MHATQESIGTLTNSLKTFSLSKANYDEGFLKDSIDLIHNGSTAENLGLSTNWFGTSFTPFGKSGRKGMHSKNNLFSERENGDQEEKRTQNERMRRKMRMKELENVKYINLDEVRQTIKEIGKARLFLKAQQADTTEPPKPVFGTRSSMVSPRFEKKNPVVTQEVVFGRQIVRANTVLVDTYSAEEEENESHRLLQEKKEEHAKLLQLSQISTELAALQTVKKNNFQSLDPVIDLDEDMRMEGMRTTNMHKTILKQESVMNRVRQNEKEVAKLKAEKQKAARKRELINAQKRIYLEFEMREKQRSQDEYEIQSPFPRENINKNFGTNETYKVISKSSQLLPLNESSSSQQAQQQQQQSQLFPLMKQSTQKPNKKADFFITNGDKQNFREQTPLLRRNRTPQKENSSIHSQHSPNLLTERRSQQNSLMRKEQESQKNSKQSRSLSHHQNRQTSQSQSQSQMLEQDAIVKQQIEMRIRREVRLKQVKAKLGLVGSDLAKKEQINAIQTSLANLEKEITQDSENREKIAALKKFKPITRGSMNSMGLTFSSTSSYAQLKEKYAKLKQAEQNADVEHYKRVENRKHSPKQFLPSPSSSLRPQLNIICPRPAVNENIFQAESANSSSRQLLGGIHSSATTSRSLKSDIISPFFQHRDPQSQQSSGRKVKTIATERGPPNKQSSDEYFSTKVGGRVVSNIRKGDLGLQSGPQREYRTNSTIQQRIGEKRNYDLKTRANTFYSNLLDFQEKHEEESADINQQLSQGFSVIAKELIDARDGLNDYQQTFEKNIAVEIIGTFSQNM